MNLTRGAADFVKLYLGRSVPAKGLEQDNSSIVSKTVSIKEEGTKNTKRRMHGRAGFELLRKMLFLNPGDSPKVTKTTMELNIHHITFGFLPCWFAEYE